jgi:SNF2 family DNA or RNA helicase
MLTRKQMRPYQVRAERFLTGNWCAALFLDMGLGKTVSTLTALLNLFTSREIVRVVIVAPLRPAEGVWRQEAAKWAHLRGLTFSLLTGSEKQRLKGMDSSAQIHIINPENLVWFINVLRSRETRDGWPYDALVIDESSMFKTPKAKRFMSIRHQVKKFKRRVLLTGTPAPKGLLDLWSQVFILDEGERLGQQVGRYRSQYFSPSGYMGYGYVPDPGAEEKIMRLISPLVLTMRAEDYLELPPTLKQNVWVDLPPKARELYIKIEKEMFLQLETGSTEAVSAAAVSAKCWQLANGAIYVDTPTGVRTWEAVHDAKLHALDEVLEGTGGNKLVAYYFKPDLARLQKAYPKAPCVTGLKGAAFEQLQKEWNEGKHPVMFIHPQSGGHGLNLQFGGNTIVFFSMLYGHEWYRQVCERVGAARQVGGRFDHVMVKHILARDTVDEVMLATQQRRFTDERRVIGLLHDYRRAQALLS